MNWSVGFEHDEYEQDRGLVIQDSVDAVKRTVSGYWVNLVTPAVWGDPELYVSPVLRQLFGEHLRIQLIDQCGCGGYVLRVWK